MVSICKGEPIRERRSQSLFLGLEGAIEAPHLKAIEQFEDRFDQKIKNAKIYPDWAVVIFIICLIVTVTLSSYFFLKLWGLLEGITQLLRSVG